MNDRSLLTQSDLAITFGETSEKMDSANLRSFVKRVRRRIARAGQPIPYKDSLDDTPAGRNHLSGSGARRALELGALTTTALSAALAGVQTWNSSLNLSQSLIARTTITAFVAIAPATCAWILLVGNFHKIRWMLPLVATAIAAMICDLAICHFHLVKAAVVTPWTGALLFTFFHACGPLSIGICLIARDRNAHV
jgi:hypothetical protein